MNSTEFMLDIIEKSEYATGADASHWKGKWVLSRLSSLDLDVLRAVLDFMIIRVGYGAQDGTQVIDSQFEERYKVLKQLPEIIRGAYWYMSSHSSISHQLDAMEKAMDGKVFDFIVLDVEKSYNEFTKVFAVDVNRLLYYMKQRFPGKKIFVYANKWHYDELLTKYTPGGAHLHYPLWVAVYPWKSWVLPLTEWFKNFWASVFTSGEWKPKLPSGRGTDGYEIVQLIDASGIGNEIGFDSDMVDFNKSRRKKDEFIDWLFTENGYPERWEVGEDVPEPNEPDLPESPVDISEYEEKLSDLYIDLEALNKLAESAGIYIDEVIENSIAMMEKIK